MVLGRFMRSLYQSHWQAIKHILRYIKGMQSDGNFYFYDNDMEFIGYTNSDWVGDVETQRALQVIFVI